MVNLKRETEMKLKEHGKGVDDIVWLGQYGNIDIKSGLVTEGYRVSNRHGLNHLDVEYENVADTDDDALIPLSLFVVGEDWWLQRKVMWGYEQWVYKEIPQPPKEIVREGVIQCQ